MYDTSDKAYMNEAIISDVEPSTAAWVAGFEPGDVIVALNGAPVTDILDWRWRADGNEITLDYRDVQGETGTIELQREPGENWGFVFDDVVFDGIRNCCNACTFCFTSMLPSGLRESLYTRDDDYRLSFISGTFVTLTNVSEADEQRIIEQHLSPLHVSLHAVDPDARKTLMGKHADRGLATLERLLDKGVQAHIQIVLVPGVNDGDVLNRTLEWLIDRPGILSVGIVPLGYTRYQDRFTEGFEDPKRAESVLKQVERFQQEAQRERGQAWVWCADEFYCNAYGDRLLEHLPEASFYADFPLFEDGIGIIRSVVDDWKSDEVEDAAQLCNDALMKAGLRAYLVSGEAQRPYLGTLIERIGLTDKLVPVYIPNSFFGGNVNVTGLLCGVDIISALKDIVQNAPGSLLCIPSILFNDDGFTLDGINTDDLAEQIGSPITVVSLGAKDQLEQIAQAAKICRKG